MLSFAHRGSDHPDVKFSSALDPWLVTNCIVQRIYHLCQIRACQKSSPPDTMMNGARLHVVDTALCLCCRKSAEAQERWRLPKVSMQIGCNILQAFVHLWVGRTATG